MVSCRDFVLLVRALMQPFSDLPYDQPAAQPPAQLLALRVPLPPDTSLPQPLAARPANPWSLQALARFVPKP